ncbi:MAG: hypothetical protein H5U20_12055, partial [Rhodobacteraceae bacterium]|nr:hypothetical protein [Paracoccaceae bacterium]
MAAPVPIHARSLGLLAPGRVRRILTLAGWQVRATGRPGPGDAVAVWGHGRTARRGEALAAQRRPPDPARGWVPALGPAGAARPA